MEGGAGLPIYPGFVDWLLYKEERPATRPLGGRPAPDPYTERP